MDKIKKKIAILSIVLLAGLSGPQEVVAQSLEEAVHAAVLNHPQIEQAKARLGAAEEEKFSARSGLFPTVSVGGTVGRLYSDNSSSRGSVTTRGAAYSGLGEVTASLQQPIFDGFETLNRLKSTNASKESASLQIEDAREQIAYQTTQAYIEVLQAKSILIRLKNQEAKLDDYIQRIETNVDDGGADEAQLQQAIDVKVVMNGFIADYTAQLRTAESRLMELTGFSHFSDITVPVFNEASIPDNIQDAVLSAEDNHPAIQTVIEAANAAGYDIDAEQALLHPEVLGEIAYLKNDKREEIGGEVEDRRAVLRMNWNFETGGGQNARIRQRKHEENEARARVHEIRGQIIRDIKIAYANRDAALRRVENQNERITLNKKLFSTYQAQFEGGLVGLLQLLQADNQLFNTEIEKTVYQYRLLAAQYGIVASLGRLQDTVFQGKALESAALEKNSE